MGCGNEVLTDPREGVLQDMPNRLWWPSIESALYLRKTSEVGDQSHPDLHARVQATAAQRPSPARRSRVIAIDVPTDSLQPMGSDNMTPTGGRYSRFAKRLCETRPLG